MTKQIILIGGGGHGKACVEVIESLKEYSIKGFIDSSKKKNETVCGYPVLGSDEEIPSLSKAADIFFLITVGQIKNSDSRLKIYEEIKKAGGKFATVISSSAIVSKRSTIGQGTIVMHQVIVNADSKIGSNVILNNKSMIEHDCSIADHVHISTGAVINGNCSIGSRVFVGSGSILRNGVSICPDVVIGAGSYVNRSIAEPGIYAGSPVNKING